MSRPRPRLVGTLADLILLGHELTVNYESCLHRAGVTVRALAAPLGEHYRVQAFIERAVCSKCGARWPNLSVTVIPARATGYQSGDLAGAPAATRPGSA